MSHGVSTMHYLEYVILSKIVGEKMEEKKQQKTLTNAKHWLASIFFYNTKNECYIDRFYYLLIVDNQ